MTIITKINNISIIELFIYTKSRIFTEILIIGIYKV